MAKLSVKTFLKVIINIVRLLEIVVKYYGTKIIILQMTVGSKNTFQVILKTRPR